MKNQPEPNSVLMVLQKATSRIPGFIFFIIALLATYQSKAQVQQIADEKAKMDERVKSTLKENAQTIRFLENKGQLENKDVLYYFQNGNNAVYVEKERIRFVALKDTLVENDEEHEETHSEIEPQEGERTREILGSHTFSLYLSGSNPSPAIKLGDAFTTKYNYFLGDDPNAWVSGVRASKELTLEDIYPGIHLRLYSNSDGSMEFDWVMDAGADYTKVKMHFEGQDGLFVDPDGSLKVGLRFTDVKFNIPESYQVTDHGKVPVSFAFAQSNNNTIEFATQSSIDVRYPIVIDPTLSWGSFFDANDTGFDDYLFAVQVDPSDGMLYCAGGTNRQVPTNAAPYDANGYLNTVSGLNGAADALPHVAVIYRINSAGTDIVDLTLYGPSSVVAADNTLAHGLSLSTNNVFISGVTTSTIPTTGSPFDGTRNAGDGFVAIFTKDLGTLNYATYLGGTGDEVLGVTSIRALSDNSFIAGLTANAALPAAYISGTAPDMTFGTGTEMYIAKFTANNTLSWGTYVGGTDAEVFNDLEVFPDGRVAFAGYGTGQLTEVNSAAGRSTNTNNTDGIIGVLNATGTAFNYLDEIGGANNDRINDVEIVGETLYWTGSAKSGFPVPASGVFDSSQNGGTDVIVGSVSAAGTTGYNATFYGTASGDLGNGIRLVTSTNCAGVTTTFLLVFGTVGGSGLPTQNIGAETLFNNTYQGGLDMFFAGFSSNLLNLTYGTYMGGTGDDYLGSTGDPRGANHLWVNNVNVYLGTTTHSTIHVPTLVSGGFDLTRTNEASGEDTHLIISIQFPSFIESDYSDAPASYGTPSHTLDCTHLKIGTLLDAESASTPTTLANGDDLAGIDDEDGISTLPSFSDGGPQNVSVTVNNINNSTGATANLYGWIDFNSNGAFEASEFASTTVATGSVNVSKVLTWTGVTVSGAAANHYLRIRLTTNTLNDNGGTSAVDERSTASASNGEVEDYRAIDLTCPTATTSASCLTQAQIHTAYLAWIATAKAGGGCNDGTLTNNNPAEPVACVGGTSTVTFTYTSACAPLTTTCMSTFTVPADASPVIVTCAVPRTISGCNTGAITTPAFSAVSAASTEAVFESSPNSGNTTDDCAITAVTYIDVASGTCPIVVTRKWTVSDACGHSATCNQTITVQDNSSTAPVIITCAVPRPISGCTTADITTPPFSAVTAASSEVVFESAPNNGNTSDNCGITSVTYIDVAAGSCPTVVTRKWTISDACGNSTTCNQTITITDSTPPTASNPAPTSVQCIAGVPAADPLVVTTEADNCSTPTVTLLSNTNNGGAGCAASPYIATRIYRVTDACGNTVNVTHIITAIDNTPPTASNPTPTSVQCIADVPAADPLIVTTEADNCSTPTVTLLSNTNNGGAGCAASPYIATRIYRVTDACGNTVNVTHTITAIDNTAPVIMTCAVPRSLVGCNTTVITTPPFSATTAASTESVFETSPNSGNTSDNCGISTVTYIDVATGSCPIVVTRRWTVGDACGNTSTCNQTITITDTTPPTASNPAPTSVQCIANVPAPDPLVVTTEADNCSTPTVTLLSNTNNGGAGCAANPYIETRIYRVTDACGNTVNVTHTVTAIDNTPPTASNPAPTSVQCITNVPAPDPLVVTTEADNCSTPTVTLLNNSNNGGAGCAANPYIETRIYRVTDACGNTVNVTHTITAIDNTPPTASNPAPTTVQCIADVPAPDPLVVTTEADNCTTPTVTLLSNTNNGGAGCAASPYIATRIYRVTDACGNTVNVTHTITAIDNTAPVIVTCAATRTIEGCNTSVILTPPFSATTATSSESVFESAPNNGNTSDNCGISTVTYIDVATGSCPIVVTRRWTVSDACGNTATCNQTINITDTTPPTASNPAPTSVQCVASVPAPDPLVVINEADNCSTPTVTLLSNTNNGGSGCPASPFIATRIYRVTDACGNTVNVTHTITAIDNIPPTASNPAPTSVQCIADIPAPDPLIVTTEADNCSTPTVTLLSNTNNGGAGCAASPYIATRIYRVTDACGNTVNVTHTITAIDNTSPVIVTCAATRTIEGCTTAAILTPPFSATTAASSESVFETTPNSGNTSDNCGISSVTYIDVATGSCPIVVTRRWTVSDACGNTATCNQTINITDTTPPTASNPAPTSVQCVASVPAPDPQVVINEADNCSTPTVTLLSNTNNGGSGCPASPFIATRIYRVTDACGNTVNVTHTVTAIDNTPPTASNPAPTSVQCIADIPAPDPLVVINEADNCSTPTVTLLSNTNNGGAGCAASPYIATRIYRVTDACGNTVNVTHTLTAIDNTAPVIVTCAPTRTIEGCNTTVILTPPFSAATATSSESVFESSPNNGNTSDNCGISAVTYIDVSTGSCPIVVTRRWTVSDACGNTATCNQTINITDTTPPTASNPAPTSVQCIADIPAPDPLVVTTEADNCSTPTVTLLSNTNNGGAGCAASPYIATRIYRVTDACGNTVNVTHTLTAIDNTAPVIITCAVPRIIDGCNTSAVLNPPFSATTAASSESVFESAPNSGNTSDNCGISSVTYRDVAVGACPIVVTRRWTVSDACGNTATCNQTITVRDITPPVCQTQNITVTVDPLTGVASITPSQVNNGSSDACSSVTLAVSPSNFSCSNSGPNTVVLTVTDACGNTSTCTATVTVTGCADLSLTKTVSYNSMTNVATFTVTVTNNGPSPATGIEATDQLPNGYTYVSNTPSQGSYANGTGLWLVGNLAVNASATLVINATVNSGLGLNYLNKAQITKDQQYDVDSDPSTDDTIDDFNDGIPDDDEANATLSTADLSLTKTAGTYNPATNQIVFTITVLNSGPTTATNVKVTDQLPNGYNYVSNTPSQGSYNNVTGLWTIGTMANGASVTLTITASVKTGIGLNYTNAAQITDSDQIDPDSNPHTGPTVDEDGDGNGDDDDEDNAKPIIADLSLTKTAGIYNSVTNQIVFTITILNSGPDGATNVQVTDQLPNGYTYVSSSPSQGTYNNVTGLWTVGVLANGVSRTLTITAIVNTGTGLNFTNAAQVTHSDQIDPDSSPNTGPTIDEDGDGNGDDDDEDNAIPIIADLSLTKTAGIYNPVTNQLVFTITVLNSGPNGATGVQVTDQLPNAYSFVSSSPSQGAYNNITGLWTVGSLSSGSSATLTITVTVNTGTGLVFTNAAQITNSDQIDPDSSPDTGPTIDEDGNGNGDDDDEDNATPIIADLSLTKTAGIFNPVNNQLVFTITVLNSGPNGATGVQVTDQLPNGYTYVSSTPSQGAYNNISGLWTVGNIANGGSATLTITTTVLTGNGLIYTNAAQITNSDQIDPDSSPDTGPTIDEDGNGNGDDDDEDNATPIIADLSLTKTAGSYNSVTNQLVFTITVNNSGPNGATGVQVTDQLPSGYTFVSSSPSQGSYNNISGLWTVGNIANGGSATLTITTTVLTGTGLVYTNAAQITNSDQIDPDSSPDTGPTVDEDGNGNGDDDDEDFATPIIADLSLTKTVGIFNPVTNQIVFTITVTNNGPDGATGVKVTDQLPNGYTYVSNTPSQGSYNNVTGIWTVGVLANGVSRTLMITATVNTGTGLVFTNAAQITDSDQIDPDSSPDTGPTVDEDGNGNGDDDDEDNATPIIADLSLTKTAGIFNPVNNQLVFTITVLNSGPNGATGVQVTDQLPNGYTYVSSTPSQGSYSNVTGLWTVGNLANGSSATLTITTTVLTGTGLVYANAAQITNSDQIDPDSSPDTGPTVDENGDGNGDDDDEDSATPLIADLSLTKTAGLFNPVTNQLTFTITVLNSGPNGATGVQVTDQLPNGYSYVSSSPSQGSYNNITGLWTVGNIANGGSATLTITSTVLTGTGLVYTNAAQITNSDQIDPDSSPDTGPTVDENGDGNGDDDDEDNATPLIADLSLTKTVGIFNPVNNQLVFTITLNNAGPNGATGVQVTDQLPNAYTYVSSTPSQGSYANGTGLWTVGSIANGGSATLTITVTVNTGTGLVFTNAAQITNSDQIDPDSSPDTGPAIDEDGNGNGDDDDEDNATPIIADLSLTKTVGLFNPVNNQLVFTITVSNAGPNGATGVQVTDQLPNGYSYVSSTPSQGTYANGTGLWTVGSIANGGSATLTITVTVNTGTGLVFANAAQITNSDQIDPDSSPDTGPTIDEDGNGNGDDDDEDTVTPLIADLSLTKTAGIFNPVNNQLVFTITINNAGPNGATGVQVTDQLPNGYSYVSSTPSQGTYNNVTGLWNVGSLANGSSATLTITTTVLTGTGLVYANAAQITNSDQIDPDSSPDTGPTVDENGDGNGDDDDEDIATPLIADLSLTKTAGLFNPVNNQLVFTITVSNAGPNGATGVQVTDQLPNGYTFISSTPSQGSYNNITGLWTVGNIANGGSATLTITSTVLTGTGLVYTNAAQITNSDQIDPDSSPDTGPTVDENGDGNGDDDDEDSATPLIADLSLTKTAGIFNPVNNQLVFTLTLLNSGPNGATGVQVTDQLPSGYSFVSSTPSQGTYNNVTGLWNVGSLANGSSATLTITTTVLTGTGLVYVNSTQITNSDQIDPDSSPDTGPTVDENGDGNGDDDDEDSATPLIADLSLTKTAGIFNPVNNQLVFTLTLSNAGPNGATGVQVTDQLPSGYSFVSSTPSQGTYNNVTGLWNVGSLANGSSATLTITTTVLTGTGLVYANAAQVTNSDQIDPDSSPDTGPTVDENGDGNGDDDDEDNATPLIADLSLTKTAGIFNPVNNQLVFTVTVFNSGPNGATGVQVTDQLPSGYSFVSSSPSQGSYNNITGLWTVGSLANGSSATLTITTTVLSGTGLLYTNAAQITNSDQIDPDSSPDTGPTVDEDGNGNGDDDDEDNATPLIADLSLTKTIASYNSTSNQVVFTITVLNSGPNGATGVKVTDQLPNGFTYVSNSPSQGSYNNVTGLWTIGSMANGASVTLMITATVNSGVGVIYTNAAQITDSDQIDPDSSPDTGPLVDEDGNGNGDDDDEDNVTLPVSDLSLTKTVNTNSPNQNSNVTYTITVTNSGPNNATGVSVKDILPAGLAYVSNVASVGIYSNVTGIWTIGSLANGASQTLQIVATVTGSGTIVNFAEIITADQADPDSDPHTSFNQDDHADNVSDDDEANVAITVNCGTCNVINGPTNPVCPGTTSIFNAQVAGLCNNPVYTWTVTGNVLNFVPNGSSVTVTAGSICGQTYTVSLSIDCQSCGTSPIVCMTNVLVQDATPPVIISCAAPRTIQGCGTGAITDPPFSATIVTSDESVFENLTNNGNASDGCGIASVTYVDVSTGVCPTVVTRRWTVSDACGNSATCNQTINVNDTTNPVISACAVTRTIEGCSTSVITSPSFSNVPVITTESVFESAPNNGNTSDNCGVVAVTYQDVAAGSCPIVVTRRWTVTDACGNTSTCNQTINVTDTTVPFFTSCPGNSVINCPATPVFGTPAASDLCDASVAITSSDRTTLGNCPGRYNVTRTWTATDDCGNTATCSATITVKDDTAPQIHCPSDLVLTCDAGQNYPALINAWIATATASDACDASVSITTNYDGISYPSFSCQGGLVITFTATDDCGNTSTCSATVTKPCFNLEAWVYLEGSAVNPNGGNSYTLPMRTSLNDLHVLPGQVLVDPFFGNKYSPPGQPYSIAPWNYMGNEGNLFDSGGNPNNATAGYPATVVDWVLVSLRLDSAGTAGPVCQAAALLHKDGTIQFVKPLNCCGVNENQLYYVVIEHRNHLLVMSDSKAPFINHKLSYDFRFQQSWEDPFFSGLNLFAREKEILPGKFAMFTGNGNQTPTFNADTDINFDDRSYWESQNGAVGFYRIGDYNLNGDTNFNDRIAWERNNGKFTSVPRN